MIMNYHMKVRRDVRRGLRIQRMKTNYNIGERSKKQHRNLKKLGGKKRKCYMLASQYILNSSLKFLFKIVPYISANILVCNH